MNRSAVSLFSKSLLAVSLLAAPAGAGARIHPVAVGTQDAGSMSCEALAAEIDALPPAPDPAEQPRKKKKKGLGFLRMLGAVSPLGGMVGGVGGVGGLLASSALSVAGSTAAREGDRPDDGPAPDDSKLRRSRLIALSAEKGC
jgi:hypothetical protein